MFAQAGVGRFFGGKVFRWQGMLAPLPDRAALLLPSHLPPLEGDEGGWHLVPLCPTAVFVGFWCRGEDVSAAYHMRLGLLRLNWRIGAKGRLPSGVRQALVERPESTAYEVYPSLSQVF